MIGCFKEVCRLFNLGKNTISLHKFKSNYIKIPLFINNILFQHLNTIYEIICKYSRNIIVSSDITHFHLILLPL